jgi:hypothetical protein
MEEGHALELIIRNMDVDTRKLYLGF